MVSPMKVFIIYIHVLVIYCIKAIPGVEISATKIVVAFGDDVAITCSVQRGNPSNYVYVITNVKTTSATTGPTHIINEIQAADLGVYRCDVTNDAGTGNATIEIQGEPQI